ncbi:MAG: hypothetical protein QHC90_22805 [Shinella sp.]|nr:hypothetical protein [Shinella sp.]
MTYGVLFVSALVACILLIAAVDKEPSEPGDPAFSKLGTERNVDGDPAIIRR